LKTVKVKIVPDGKTVSVDKGSTIFDALVKAGIGIRGACEKHGLCGKCRVIVRKGRVESTDTSFLSKQEKAAGFHLACATHVNGNIEIEVPRESRADRGEVLTGGVEHGGQAVDKRGALFHSPLATKIFMSLPHPTLQDSVSDLGRVCRELERSHGIFPAHMALDCLRGLGPLLRKADFRITVTLGKTGRGVEIFRAEAGNTAGRNFGVAVDIGTTTVVANLTDLVSGHSLGALGTYNSQAVYGDDIITRIVASEGRGVLEKLRAAVVKDINGLVGSLSTSNGVSLDDINAVMCAGNPTMLQLMLGIDPRHIRMEPYAPTAAVFPVIRAAEAGIGIHRNGLMGCLPAVSSYVGGDIVAGVLASGMAERDELALLIDLGTNGEMVLGNKEWLACCACSAGPAFEGSGISCGMRATPGAVQKFAIGPRGVLKCGTVGDEPPAGICGSGMIDLISELFKARIIDRAGKLAEAKAGSHIRETDEGKHFVVAPADMTIAKRAVVLKQSDIDNVMRAKAAVFAGVRCLLRKMGFEFTDLRKVHVAGAFGNVLDVKKGISIGLLPDLPAERFEYIGNGSVAGARLALLSSAARDRADEIARKMTYVELSSDNMFTEEFTSAMFLPHTDMGLFPSVGRRA
jgi:uncharacterized 2Fe-2S/4Fe-4S cluster protein (DUF4445 family)